MLWVEMSSFHKNVLECPKLVETVYLAIFFKNTWLKGKDNG